MLRIAAFASSVVASMATVLPLSNPASTSRSWTHVNTARWVSRSITRRCRTYCDVHRDLSNVGGNSATVPLEAAEINGGPMTENWWEYYLPFDGEVRPVRGGSKPHGAFALVRLLVGSDNQEDLKFTQCRILDANGAPVILTDARTAGGGR